MLEQQQVEAQTLHRMLGFKPRGMSRDEDDEDDELACAPCPLI